MKKIKILLLCLIVGLTSTLNAQKWEDVKRDKKGTLIVRYFENEPYAYSGKNGKLMGIEVDILHAFADWIKKEKGVELTLEFKKYDEFEMMYSGIKNAPANVIGAGSITISSERAKEVRFSAPYLKNVAVLITDGAAGTARNDEELASLFKELRPVTIKGSIHQNYLENIYKSMKVIPEYTYVDEAGMIPKKIEESSKYFGYMDVISFWMYIKNNQHYVKMHSIANKQDEEFGFIFSMGSDWSFVVNEFFERGFGFTSTKAYRKILETHLGYEVIEKVEINQ